MLCKTVICAEADGTCKLVEVPFTWQHGDQLPADAIAQVFPTVDDALAVMSGRGHLANRVHVPKPAPRQIRPSHI